MCWQRRMSRRAAVAGSGGGRLAAVAGRMPRSGVLGLVPVCCRVGVGGGLPGGGVGGPGA